MGSKLPESTRLAYARQLADEALTLVPGVERLAEIVVELRTDDLYRLLGFDTWEQFCKGYLGVSRWTANRLIAGPKPKSITAGQGVAAVHPAPQVESDALKIPAASTEAPAKQSEGVHGAGGSAPREAGDDAVAPAVPAPSGPSSAGGLVSEQTPSPPAGPSSGGSRTTAPPRLAPTGEAPTSPGPAPLDPTNDDRTYRDESRKAKAEGASLPERPPSDRQLAAQVFAAMREVDPTDAGPVTTPEEATFLRQWAQRTLDAWKAVYAPPAPAEKPQRRQGTITRPADRVKVNGHPAVVQDLTRRDVTPMFKA